MAKKLSLQRTSGSAILIAPDSSRGYKKLSLITTYQYYFWILINISVIAPNESGRNTQTMYYL